MSSVYQTGGRPLSKQALYQQKLKQGVYNSPGRPSVGVNSNASDAAALLAASSDLSVKPSYERLQAAPEAQTAALAAKKDKILAWSRDSTDPYADAAAANAKAKPRAAGPAVELGIPTYNKGSVYRQAEHNSTSTMTSRTTPEKSVSKHGLASKSASAALDMGKVSRLADQNSTKLLNSRFNPEHDYRSGLVGKPTEYLNANEEKLAAQSATASLSMKHGAGYTDSVSAQKRTSTFQAHEVVDATLIAAASAAASERLKTIRLTAPADLKEQALVYSKALSAAQKNSEERLKAHKAGMVDLGGGLHLPISEVDKLAGLIVTPVLADLESKAAAQREIDAEKARKHAELQKKHQEAKQEELARKERERQQQEQEKMERLNAHEDRKQGEDEKFLVYQGERNEEVEGKRTELRELQEQHATEKEALLTEKKENEDRITEEETGLISGRKEELDKMQAERDELLKATLDELAVESAKLKDLTDSKNALADEVASAEKLGEEYESKIAELKKQLEETNQQIEKFTTDLEDVTGKRTATDKEVEELQASAAEKEKNAEQEHKELDEKVVALENEKKENLATKEAHKKSILAEIDDKVLDEKKINKELPDHLQSEVPEHRFRDVGSLFTVELKAKKAEPKLPEPAKPATTQAVDDNKRGIRSRFSSIKKAFKTPAANQKPTSASKKEPVTVSSALKGHETHSGSKSIPEAASDVTNFDDLSINHTKKGGVFKEDI